MITGERSENTRIWLDPSSTLMMDADDEEVDAANSVGTLHMNPFRSDGGAGLACVPGLARAKPLAHSKSSKMR